MGASSAAAALESKVKYAVEHANAIWREEKDTLEGTTKQQKEEIKRLGEKNEEVRI